jgi:hypothetical protein
MILGPDDNREFTLVHNPSGKWRQDDVVSVADYRCRWFEENQGRNWAVVIHFGGVLGIIHADTNHLGWCDGRKQVDVGETSCVTRSTDPIVHGVALKELDRFANDETETNFFLVYETRYLHDFTLLAELGILTL